MNLVHPPGAKANTGLAIVESRITPAVTDLRPAHSILIINSVPGKLEVSMLTLWEN